MRILRLFTLALLPLLGAAADPAPTTPRAASPFASLNELSLHNAYRVTDKVLSGAAPEGDAAFAALRALGVKTIISVDGARPDVATARKHGFRYVHLPIGYDGVAAAEGRAIAKALDELPGPIYIHCHHGQHRSASAVAVACVMNGRLKPEQAESVLKTFGTGENYTGLWASARAARPLDPAALRGVKVDYREVAPIPRMAEAMVAIDGNLDRLKLAEQANWRPPGGHPDVDPAHEALQLTEHLRELGRTHDVQGRPAAFRTMLGESEAAAKTLHESLAAWSKGGSVGTPPPQATDAMKTIAAGCSACHKSFRD
jgi:protein tyrosine phosphatase (PTP) superfamily phosphohydrolase (DUF442 family)